MHPRLVFIFAFFFAINSWAQNPDLNCNCPPNKFAGTKPEAVFTLPNGKIALCGYAETKDNEKLYSEFVLAACGDKKIIDFWDAITTCRIVTNNDTLRVEELKNLPTGDDLKFVSTVWNIDKLYFKNGQVQRNTSLNRKIRKYSQQEIKSVLAEYEHLNRKLDYNDMDLINKLFMAAISGDKTARKYLTDKNRFEYFDGAFKEDYDELIAMLKNWEER
ncbi:MAG: hypothetical protein QM762_04500 [Chryseolinea sp.]